MVFAVCDAIWYWKLPHVLADGSVGAADEVQTPTREGELFVVVGVAAGVDVPVLDVDVGDRTLDECSNPHAPTKAEATSTPRSEADRFGVMVTNLSRDARI